MFVAIAVTATLAISGLFALVVVRVLRRALLIVAIVGDLLATTAIAILVGAPLVHGMAGTQWPWLLTTYFLAMANRLVDGPYPFFWSPHWVYLVGSLTPLIVLGACVSLVAGHAARRSAPRAALVIEAVASCLLAAYVVAGIYAAAWGGVPL